MEYISVLITTFNVEKYISKCITSALQQKTNYTFKIVVLDDCSTDTTVEQIKNIINNHPKGNLIELHQNTINLGVVKNAKKIIGLAKTPYIAILDGDDYWVDDKKLEKQCSFLEKHVNFNISVGLVESYYAKTNKRKIFIDGWHIEKQTEYDILDYIKSPFSQNSTYFFRNHIEFPDWYDGLQSNDATIFCLAAKDKKIKYFKEVFSVYRIHQDNYSSKKKNKESYQKTNYFLKNIDKHTNYKHHKSIVIRKWINKMYYFNSVLKNFFLIDFLIKAAIVFLFFFNKIFIKTNKN